MSDEKSVQMAMWVMIVVQTIGSVDLPGKGPRKLPAPRSYVVIVVAMGVLQVLADVGAGRAAKAMAWTAVLAAAVLGPFGVRFGNFLNTVATQFGNPTTSGSQLQTEVSQLNTTVQPQPVRPRTRGFTG